MFLDPFAVAGHTGEHSRVLLLATGRRSERGQTNLDLVGGQHQWATGVAVAGGYSRGGRDADVRVADGGVVSLLARGVGDDLHVGVLQAGSHAGGGIGGAAPAGGDHLITIVGGIASGQLYVVDGSAVVHVRDADQRDVVAQSAAVPIGVDDDVLLGNVVLDLGAVADSAAQVNLDGVNTIK